MSILKAIGFMARRKRASRENVSKYLTDDERAFQQSQKFKREEDSWLKRPERGTEFMLRFGLWGVLTLGRRFVWLCSYPITAYFFCFSPKGRKASRICLSRILGRKIRWYHIFKHYQTFGMTILDRVYFVSGKLDALKITVHYDDTIKVYLNGEKSALLLGSHLGCFEALRALGIKEKSSFKALMYTHLSNAMNNLIHELNPDISNTIIQADAIDSLLQVHTALDEGCLVGILGDRVILARRSQQITFLGKSAAFPEQPLLISYLCQTPILLFFAIYRGENEYDIFIEFLMTLEECQTMTRERYVHEGLIRYAARLEHYTKQFPYNWFNFYDFWGEHHAHS